ncbi:MAG: T9SS type A sorting domain-containing protein [Bacteroidetes bacterium]|nr:T9SS type A sorting domain-containing protein [Bacteroidota bacterium]
MPYVPRIADEINSSIAIYPNPQTTFLNISTTEQIVKVEIISMTGAKMFEAIDNCNTIDISMLSYGMYQVICNFSDGSSVTKPFIKL